MSGRFNGTELRHPVTSEPEYTDEELAFMKALDQYKRDNQRPHITTREVLRVAVAMGYRLVAEPAPLPRFQGGRRGSQVAARRNENRCRGR